MYLKHLSPFSSAYTRTDPPVMFQRLRLVLSGRSPVMWGLGRMAEKLAYSSYPGMVIPVSQLSNARIKAALSMQGIEQIKLHDSIMRPAHIIASPNHWIAAFKLMAAGMEEGKEYRIGSNFLNYVSNLTKMVRKGSVVEIS